MNNDDNIYSVWAGLKSSTITIYNLLKGCTGTIEQMKGEFWFEK